MEIYDYPDNHYCFVSIKCARQFATVFTDMSVVISQDDKAKISFRIPALGQTFQTLQLVYEPVHMADHDFPIEYGQKLVSSVYLIIKSNDSNNKL